MADITKVEREAIAANIAKALVSERPEPAAAGRGAAATAAAADPKKFFCENWPMIKAGLGVLQGFVPIFVKPFIGLVITAGDTAAGVICK